MCAHTHAHTQAHTHSLLHPSGSPNIPSTYQHTTVIPTLEVLFKPFPPPGALSSSTFLCRSFPSFTTHPYQGFPPTTPGHRELSLLWTPMALLEYAFIRHHIYTTRCICFSLRGAILSVQLIRELLGQDFCPLLSLRLNHLSVYSSSIHPPTPSATTTLIKPPLPLAWTITVAPYLVPLLLPSTKPRKAMLNLITFTSDGVTLLYSDLQWHPISLKGKRPKCLHWLLGPCECATSPPQLSDLACTTLPPERHPGHTG